MSNLLLTLGKNLLSPVSCTYPKDLLQLSQSVSRTGHSENTWNCWTQSLPVWEKLPASLFAVTLHLGVLSWNNPRTLENTESYSPSMLWFIQGNRDLTQYQYHKSESSCLEHSSALNSWVHSTPFSSAAWAPQDSCEAEHLHGGNRLPGLTIYWLYPPLPTESALYRGHFFMCPFYF